MRARILVAAVAVGLAAAILAGCVSDDAIFGDGPLTVDSGAPDGPFVFPDMPPAPDGLTPYQGDPVVYAHSSDKLYKVDPIGLTVTLIGAFAWPQGADQMTDIALDRKGKMTGISYDTVYSVDPKTAACTYLAPLQTSLGVGSYNGLSYIAVQGADTKEVLMASAGDGTVWEIDPLTGKSTKIGSFGSGLGSSGDLVSVKGKTLATVKGSGWGSNDYLASVDPQTGKATLIGDTGFKSIWGLGYWKDKVYGFTDSAQFLLIDPKTGKGTLTTTSSAKWWGAGVTTSAPVID